MNKELQTIVKLVACQFNFEPAALAAFIEVESGGKGFGNDGKILIQFEPHYFRKRQPYAPSGAWSVNKVDVQSKEWVAFNNAFSINQNSAMESTSIGLGQIMGAHWKRLGYATVGAMWDDAKKSLEKQVWQIAKFIDTDKNLKSALKTGDWHKVATIYNGAGYKDIARKYGREPYNISMAKAYGKYKALFV